MSKKKGKTPQPAAKKMTASAPKMEAFTFGEPVPVLDRRDILDYVECISNGRWYEPPVSFTGLAKSLRAAVHHSSPIYVKRNILASTFIPHPWLSQQDFSRFVLDFLVFGNAFLEKRYSTTGKVIRLETSRQNIPAVVWKRMFTGGCRPSTSRQPSRPAPCFTCWSRILIRSCTACRNISAPLTLPG